MTRKLTKFVVAFLASTWCLPSFAQVPDGSIAPDFMATDINGVEHSLSDVLAQGKTVILSFNTTDCGACIQGHQQLQNFYNAWGPAGSDQAQFFWVEADPTTSVADLQSGSGSAEGYDWTAANFPILDADGSALADLYQVASYPSTFVICAEGLSTFVGSNTQSILNVGSANCGAWDVHMDLQPTLPEPADVCGSSFWKVSFTLTNSGATDITSFTVKHTVMGQEFVVQYLEGWPPFNSGGTIFSSPSDTFVNDGYEEVCFEITELNGMSWSQTVCAEVLGVSGALSCPMRLIAEQVHDTPMSYAPTLEPLDVVWASSLGGCSSEASSYPFVASVAELGWHGTLTCLDAATAEWYLNGQLVHTDDCGMVDAFEGVGVLGTNELTVYLDVCDGDVEPNGCEKTLTTTFELGTCILPDALPFELVELGQGASNCAPNQCAIGVNPGLDMTSMLAVDGGCFISELWVDGSMEETSFSASKGLCLTWGPHEITWKMRCALPGSETVEHTQTYWCGPIFDPMLNFDLSQSSWNFVSPLASQTELAGLNFEAEFKGFSHGPLDVAEQLFAVTVPGGDFLSGNVALPAGGDLGRVEVTLISEGAVLGRYFHDLSWSGAGVGSFGTPGGNGGNTCPADLDGDNEVAISDLLMMLSAFGLSCP